MEVKVIGAPCGYHGPYTFYKGIRISPIQQQQASNDQNTSGSENDAITSQYCNGVAGGEMVKTETGLGATRATSTANNPKSNASANGCFRKPLVLALGDCLAVRPWSDSPIACLAELRMVWKDKNEQCLLTGLRLYFLPENTPTGRNGHGEDEVLAISDKVVIRADDLLNWCDDTINWHWGLRATTTPNDTPKCDSVVKKETMSDSIKTEPDENKPKVSTTEHETETPGVRSLKNSLLDFNDIEAEKEMNSRTKVAVISYPRYCRYRATLKRLENVGDEWLRTTLAQALGGFVAAAPDTRVMFCKETFDYPELETHELLCNHLAPKLKGRPRGRRKKLRSDSPSSRLRCDSAGSDSGTSEISACSIEKVYSKYSPLYVKPEFKQGTQVLATRPQLRYNPRPARTKGKSESNNSASEGLRRGLSRRRHTTRSDSNSDTNDQSDSNTNTTNRDDDENDSSDESDFTQKLIDFHEAQDSQIPKVFWIGLKRVNLRTIYQKVKQMGGYDAVTEQKMWKYLFGVDGGYNSISRKKYERALLPYERFETEQQSAQIKYERDDESDDNGCLVKSETLNMSNDRQLTMAEMSEIQRQIKAKSLDPNLHVEMSSLPVTVIVGGSRKSTSPSDIQIQQPHTTITVHQTTIHPQTLQMPTESQQHLNKNQIQITNSIQIQQITLQPTAGTSKSDANYSCNIKQDVNGQDVVHLDASGKYSGRDSGIGYHSNQHMKLVSGRGASLRHVRVKSDRSKDWNGGRRASSTHTAAPTSLGSVTVSTMKPNEKENIPYLAGSKTTTITPILGNSNKSMLRFPSSISEIIDLVDSDNDSSNSPSPTPQSQSSPMFPNMKKRKLDILRQGGLEVTAINNTIGPLNGSHTLGSAKPPTLNVPPPRSIVNNISASATSIDSAPATAPAPMFQSKCMYTKTSRIFGNPKDLIPVPTHAANPKCLDLTVQRRSAQDPIEVLRLPPATTIKKAHTSPTAANLSSPVSLAAHNLPDPNLQITLVPPLTYVQNIHNSQNHNIKRKSSESMTNFIGRPPEKVASTSLTISAKSNDMASTSAPISMPSASSPTSAVLNVPNFAHDMKISQMMLQNFLNQSSSSGAAQLNSITANDQFGASLHDNAAIKSNTSQLASTLPPSQSLTGQNPFLPMLDPMYLSSLYQTQNLFFPQALPQELLQLYKKFPQGLGIIPISKS